MTHEETQEMLSLYREIIKLRNENSKPTESGLSSNNDVAGIIDFTKHMPAEFNKWAADNEYIYLHGNGWHKPSSTKFIRTQGIVNMWIDSLMDDDDDRKLAVVMRHLPVDFKHWAKQTGWTYEKTMDGSGWPYWKHDKFTKKFVTHELLQMWHDDKKTKLEP